MRHRHPPSSGPVLYNHSGIVLSDIQQIVLRNLDFFHLRVPSCTVTATACVTWRRGGEKHGPPYPRIFWASTTHIQTANNTF